MLANVSTQVSSRALACGILRPPPDCAPQTVTPIPYDIIREGVKY